MRACHEVREELGLPIETVQPSVFVDLPSLCRPLFPNELAFARPPSLFMGSFADVSDPLQLSVANFLNVHGPRFIVRSRIQNDMSVRDLYAMLSGYYVDTARVTAGSQMPARSVFTQPCVKR